MRKVQTILILIFGLLASGLEFRNIKTDTVFSIGMLEGIPLIALCILTATFIYKNSVQFRRTKNYFSFVPPFIGLVLIVTTFAHKLWRSSVDNAPTIFTATNYNLGNDGGFILDFKADKHLKAEKRDHWMVTYYWGSYEKQGDTLLIDIPLNFKMGRHAVLQDNLLSFTDDTVHFDVYRR
jgi:hypothetical protein